MVIKKKASGKMNAGLAGCCPHPATVVYRSVGDHSPAKSHERASYTVTRPCVQGAVMCRDEEFGRGEMVPWSLVFLLGRCQAVGTGETGHTCKS